MCRCLYISVCLPACVSLCICVLSLFFMELGIDILDDSHSQLVGVELGMGNMYETLHIDVLYAFSPSLFPSQHCPKSGGQNELLGVLCRRSLLA